MKLIGFILLFLCNLPSFAGVYGTLEFGDSRDIVTEKLKKSDLVDQTMASTFMGRTGLNGAFKCKAKLAGLTYRLYFDWDSEGRLREITLRSETVEKQEYNSKLRTAWEEAEKIFTLTYGNPVQKAKFPNQTQLSNGSMLMSHIWHQAPNQSILMGTGQDQGKYFLAIRFINKRITPIRTP